MRWRLLQLKYFNWSNWLCKWTIMIGMNATCIELQWKLRFWAQSIPGISLISVCSNSWMILMSTKNVPSDFVKLSSLQLLANKGSFGVTATKARNNVRQTGASVLNQRGFVTASVTPVSVVKIRISQITVSSKISHCGDFVWKCVIKIAYRY